MSERVPRVALFTFTMDRLEYTQRMLESLSRSTRLAYHHYIIDNGSTDGTARYLRDRTDEFRHVVLNEQNRGIGPSWNQALDLIGDDYDYLVKADNDCLFVTQGWLESLVAVSRALDDRIVLSPYVEGLSCPGGYPRYETTSVAGHKVGLSRHVGGLCHLSPADAYRGFRFEKGPMRGHQDVTFSMHVRLDRGYSMGYLEDIRVQHMDTTVGQEAKYPEYWAMRSGHKQRIWGESPVVTKLMHPIRRARDIRRQRAAGLSADGILDRARAKVAAFVRRTFSWGRRPRA
jgi:glycosyltransferase involved in cell wall biosynthesis